MAKFANDYIGYSLEPAAINNINNICIIAWGLIGDVFIRVPIVEAVRQHFPSAKITVVVETLTKPVFECNRHIDEIVVFDRRKHPVHKYFYFAIKNIIIMRREKFDLCIDLYAGGSSPVITRLSNAPVRLGFDHKERLRKSYNLLVKTPDYCRQWIKDFALLLSPLGIQEDDVRVGTSFNYTHDDKNVVKDYLDKYKRYFCINLATSDVAKCWPVEKYLQLAQYIYDQYGLIPVVLTNPGQEELAGQFVSLCRNEMVNPPVLPLRQVGALIDLCEYMITGDTSLMHMSFGLKKPTLVLFTHTRPEWHIVDDCILEYCFKENLQSENWRCGKPWGSKSISLIEATSKFDRLVLRAVENTIN